MDKTKVALVIESVNSFSDRFIELLGEADHIDLKCLDIREVKFCPQNFDYILWHVPPEKRILALDYYSAAVHQGIKVFPDLLSLYLFEDKIRQSVFLDKVDSVKIVPYYYTESMNWGIVKDIFKEFPFVFKLKSGAGSINVRLVRSQFQLFRLYLVAKYIGFPQVNKLRNLLYVWKKYRLKQVRLHRVIRAMARLFVPTKRDIELGREKGYLYGQKFLANNKGDIRVIVIGNKAFGIYRKNRENDFRASGSGLISYDSADIPQGALKTTFQLSKELNTLTLACDYLYNDEGELMLVEVSYGWVPSAYIDCKGYWEEHTLKYQVGLVEPEKWILESLGLFDE